MEQMACLADCHRKHPLWLLSGVGTNAIGYDLSPKSWKQKLKVEVTSPDHPVPEEFMHPRDDDDVVGEDDDADRTKMEETKSSWLRLARGRGDGRRRGGKKRGW